MDNGVRFADVNGDLKPDIIKAKGGQRTSKTNNVSKISFNWKDSSQTFPAGTDLVTDSGKLLYYTDCNPSVCQSGYTDLGISCSGEYCTRTCSNEQCGGSWSPVWDDSYSRSVYDEHRCHEWTEGFKFCGSDGSWGGFSCSDLQRYCYMSKHIGCGKSASSDVDAQSYYLYSASYSITSGCTDSEYDSSSWVCDREGYSYCLPAGFSCGGTANCRTNCWADNFAGGIEFTDFTLRAWDGSCSNSDAEDATKQDCAAIIEVYITPLLF